MDWFDICEKGAMIGAIIGFVYGMRANKARKHTIVTPLHDLICLDLGLNSVTGYVVGAGAVATIAIIARNSNGPAE